MEKSIVIAGFGGQGALLAGQLLAYAALSVDKQVTWLPSYGPEMRGGTAHCTVVISDEAIGSPLVHNPDYVVALNGPSTAKYLPLVKSGGLLIYNSDLVNASVTRPDIIILPLPAGQLAQRVGDRHLVNTVMIGALVEQTGILPLTAVEAALMAHLPEHHRDLLAVNQRALHEGAIYPLTLAAGELEVHADAQIKPSVRRDSCCVSSELTNHAARKGATLTEITEPGATSNGVHA